MKGRPATGSTIVCLVCGKHRYCPISAVKRGAKFCSLQCSALFSKGRHRKFTEEHKRLISSHHADVSGERNPNWKGGKKQSFRTLNSGKLKKWRQSVLERDGFACRECGSTRRLEAHHLIPLSEHKSTALMSMNGVTLCRECHKKTDTYAGLARKRASLLNGSLGKRSPAVEQLLGRTLCLTYTIPHRYQAYPTVGNYAWTSDNALVIFVSDMRNDDYEWLVFIHEYVEAILCRRRGVKIEDIDAFDIAFEAKREEGNLDEPGHDPNAPYHREHVFAESIERQVAQELGVDWDAYEHAIESL